MDELDRKLFHDLQYSRNSISEKEKKIIMKSVYSGMYKYKSKKRQKYPQLAKIISLGCASIMSVAGIAYAKNIIMNNIWEEPENIVGSYDKLHEIDEEKINAQDEAKKKAYEILSKFGHKNEKIKKIELQENTDDASLQWYIETNNNNRMGFDAKEGENLWISFDSVINIGKKGKGINEVEAEREARGMCKKYGYDLSEYTKVKIEKNSEKSKESYIWYVTFYKQYEEIINPYESISIGFIPKINEVYKFKKNNIKYSNNSIVVSQDDAKQLILDTEKNIGSIYEIEEIKTKVGIVKMNGIAYLRMTDYEQYRRQQYSNYSDDNYIKYRTKSKIRKAWIVTIKYKIPSSVDYFSDEYNPFDEYFTYYVDATTKEIIGGSANRNYY